jgi:hypothetical protein
MERRADGRSADGMRDEGRGMGEGTPFIPRKRQIIIMVMITEVQTADTQQRAESRR